MPSFGEGNGLKTENIWAPVIVFAYDRLEHLQSCLGALGRAEGADSSELYIFSDGYKGDQDKDKVLAVQDYLHGYERVCPFRKLHVTYSENNKGLAESVIGGVGKVIEEYGRVVVVEDDLLVSPDFLVFMNSALTHYEKDKRIWQIGGWSPDVAELSRLQEDTFLWYRSNSWGWGIWADRWETVDWGVQDYKSFKFSIRKRHKMNRGGADMSDMLDMQMRGKINSWAIRFAYAESMSDRLTVFPRDSRIVNKGMDGSGTHCGIDTKGVFNNGFNSVMYEEKNNREIRWGEQIVSPKAERQIYRFYSGNGIVCLKRRINSLLRRFNIRKY